MRIEMARIETVRQRYRKGGVAVAANLFLLAGLLTIGGCNSAPSAASGGTSTRIAVGPVPGGQKSPVGPIDPYIGNPVALAEGRKLFNWYNCSGCHGGHAGGGMGPSLRDKTWLYGSRDDQIYDSIAQGRSQGMPAWGSKIPQDQIWKLVAYIKSMRTPDEPDPPVEPANEQVPNPSNNTPPGVGPQD